jgi:hypothetical protein
MIEVTAIANGYYGQKVRVPGEKFGIEKPEHFSITWMASDDAKVKAFVKEQANAKPDDGPTYKVAPAPGATEATRAAEQRAQRHKDWLADNGHADAPEVEGTRRINTGGTDGVVGANIPKAGVKLSAQERVAAARALTGRDDITTAKEADTILAAAQATGGSDNDDRSRDFASDPSQNAPTPDTATDGDI